MVEFILISDDHNFLCYAAASELPTRSSDPNITYSTTLETDDVNKYDVTQVVTFVLDSVRAESAYYETTFDIMGSEEHWELDDRLIDYDMLSA